MDKKAAESMVVMTELVLPNDTNTLETSWAGGRCTDGHRRSTGGHETLRRPGGDGLLTIYPLKIPSVLAMSFI